jgi:hypothetical protein
MDAEELVLANFPNAESREEAAVYQHGKLSAIMPGYWAIHPDDELDSEELGKGRTEEQAWKNAARNVRNVTPIAIPILERREPSRRTHPPRSYGIV